MNRGSSGSFPIFYDKWRHRPSPIESKLVWLEYSASNLREVVLPALSKIIDNPGGRPLGNYHRKEAVESDITGDLIFPTGQPSLKAGNDWCSLQREGRGKIRVGCIQYRDHDEDDLGANIIVFLETSLCGK